MGQQVCAPWVTPDKLCNEGSGTTTDCESGTPAPLVFKWPPEDVILAASNILYARTCYRYPGACAYEVWPCIEGNCMSDYRPCAPCVRWDAIQLTEMMPVIAVTQVTEDGVELDPSAYRLEGRYLVRIDGQRWKRNTFGLPNVEGVETIVSFTAGRVPPIELQMAAADLADEMLKACNGQDCSLAPNVKGFARRGVQVDLVSIEDSMKTGLTGIASVDRAIEVHGRCGGATMHDPAARPLGLKTV